MRLDLNVPISEKGIEETYRADMVVPTLEFLKKSGARTVAMSHIESSATGSLLPVYEYLKKTFPEMKFVPDYSDKSLEILGSPADGEIALLENLRVNEGEKKNDEVFAKKLASFGDIFVNDAFAVSHRKHASVVGVPKFLPSFAGPLLMREISELSAAFNPPHPFLFILGGAKFETKLPLVQKFLDIADKIYIGGALASDVFKARGLNVGKSVVSDNFSADVSSFLQSGKIILPKDVVVKTSEGRAVKKPDQLSDSDEISDSGPESVEMLEQIISESKFVLWNGPLGIYEKGFKDGTLGVAKAISNSSAKSIVGGGDTLAAIKELGAEEKFSFISTGGGAMLDFLANGTLPGIEVLK